MVALALSVASSDNRGWVNAWEGSTTRSTARSWGTAPVSSTEPAYFKIEFRPLTDTFIMMLTDAAKIQEARDIVTGVQTDTVSVMGTIIKTPTPPPHARIDK